MKLTFFDYKQYDNDSFSKENKDSHHEIKYIINSLNMDSAKHAKGSEGVIAFVNCDGSKKVLEKLKKLGVKYWFQRSAGYDNVDIKAAHELGIKVFRVPAYSPEAISEFAWTLLLSLNRNIHLSHIRTSIERNFSLDGLQGQTVHGKTVGVIGVGKIGLGFINIANGFGTKVIVYDEYAQKQNPSLAQKYNFKFVDKKTIFEKSDFLSLHCPLTKDTKNIVNKETIALMKNTAIIINTARGKLIESKDLLEALDHGKIRAAGIDVYANEKGIFFYDHSNDLVPDIELSRLRAHRNVILTSHQAWFTYLAIEQIAKTTMQNIEKASQNDFSDAI